MYEKALNRSLYVGELAGVLSKAVNKEKAKRAAAIRQVQGGQRPKPTGLDLSRRHRVTGETRRWGWAAGHRETRSRTDRLLSKGSGDDEGTGREESPKGMVGEVFTRLVFAEETVLALTGHAWKCAGATCHLSCCASC